MALIISKKHKYIFFHLPKNAGVSVSRALIRQETSLKVKRIASYFIQKLHIGKDNFYFSIKDLELIFFNSHITCFNFYKIFNKQKFAFYEKFVVVRNPWDRLVSRYFYSKKINKRFEKFSFKEFVNFDIKYNFDVLNQYRFCTRDKNQFCIDTILKFENLENDFNKLTLKIFNKKDLLFHSNKTNHNYYRDYYDNDLKDLVFKKFKEDINYFKYEF